MSQRLIPAAATLAAIIGGWGFARPEPPKPADVRAEVMAADRAFARAAAETGLDGWMSFMADDAVRIAPLGGKTHMGKAAVRALDATMFADAKRKLVWEPTDGGPFADGRHGFTTGRWKMVARSDEGAEEMVQS